MLNLLDEKEFACKEEILAYDRKLYYCDIPGGALPKVSDKILSLVEVRFREEKGGMRIYVVPRANSRLISSSDLLYGESVVPFSKNGGLAKRHTIVIDQNLSEFKNRTRNLTPFYELFLKTRRKNEQIRFIGLAQILNLMRVLSRKFYSFRRVLKRRKSL